MARPTKLEVDVIIKLEAAFNNGYNITEACHYAGISRDTYYAWLESVDEFSDKMDHAQLMLHRKAKEIIALAINEGDANLAFRYLQARDPDFKPKLEGGFDPTLTATLTKIRGFLDARKHDDAGGEPTATITPGS